MVVSIMRNYNNFRAAVLNKMEELFPCDGTQYQWQPWETCNTLVPVEGYDFYEMSYRIYGFGRCGVRFRLDETKTVVTGFWFFSTLPGMGDDMKEFKAWVENDLGNKPETDPICTLKSFTNAGGKANKVLSKHCNVLVSSYREHYQDGDTDNTIIGLSVHAAVGDKTSIGDKTLVCVYSHDSYNSESCGWSGRTQTTYWVTLQNLYLYADKLVLDEATLMQKSVAIGGCSIETLLKLPINWTELIGYHSGIKNIHGYLHGSRAEITICDKYITVHIIKTHNSCTRQCGWECITERYQFLLDGTDNTAAYVAYCKRKQYNEKLSALIADGFSAKQAKLWLKARAEWKHENKPYFCFEQSKLANKAFWTKLAGARGWNHAAKIIAQAGLNEELSWFTTSSFPRATDTCALIAQLCTEKMSGIGWTLTTEN